MRRLTLLTPVAALLLAGSVVDRYWRRHCPAWISPAC